MSQGELEREEARKRWKLWNQQKLLDKLESQTQEPALNNYADQIMQKLIINSLGDQNKTVGGALSKQIESNSCPVCMQLMVPPCRPMTLFPCGHTICKVCLLKNGREDRDKYQLAIQKCPMCRKQIQNYTVNINLMGLISKYVETKHKEDKEKRDRQQLGQEEIDSKTSSVEAIRIRCSIISAEENKLAQELSKYTREVEILEQVLKKVSEQKTKIRKQKEELEEKQKLVDRYAEEQEHKLKIARKNAESVHSRYTITSETLRLLLAEKEKSEFLLCKDLVSKASLS